MSAMKAAGQAAGVLDDRLGLATLVKKNIRKVFPDHWSFLLGEIALYSFIVLLLSGTFLTFWFKPSMEETVYNGSYNLLQGVHMSQAYASTVHISFDVRGGLLMRQIHHWAAILFVAAMMVHMLRIFFTGAFRKPREINWIIGVLLLNLAFIEGFTGYSLPDDLLSGTGMRLVEALVLSIPVVGTYLLFFIFGGQYPGDDIVSRLFPVHILLLPGLILALVTVHIGLIVFHKHTQYPGPGRTNKNVVGYPLLPVYMAKAGGFFFTVFGVTALMGTFMQVNPVWLYGPYKPNQVTAGSQPDWYMGWLEGAMRIMPNWETHVAGFTISWNIFIPGGLLMGILAMVMLAYPFVERWVTGDAAEHHVLDRPRNQPTRTAFGVAAITCYGLFWIGGGNDIIATHFDIAINHITWVLRFLVFIGPVVAFIIARRVCIGLQRHDHETLLHGHESGTIVRRANGEFTEVHAPVTDEEAYVLTAHARQAPDVLGPATDENGVVSPAARLPARLHARASRFYFGKIIQKPTRAELEDARAHQNGHENGHSAGGGGQDGDAAVVASGQDADRHEVASGSSPADR